MKRSKEYIFKSLSTENIKKLEEFINDDNFDNYYQLLKRHMVITGIDETKYEDFFNIHGLSKLNWGRKNSAVKQFINLFSEADHLDILEKIINENGIISINDLPEEGNLFKDQCSDFLEEAKTISLWTNGGSTNAGPCEILLKFILKEGRGDASGDVTIGVDENNKILREKMEIKASILKKNAVGGHAAGQKGKIRNACAIYFYLDNYLFGFDTDNSHADKLQYFQNKTGFNDFNEKIIKTKLNNDLKKLSNGIVDALCFQYNFITNDKNATNTLKNIKDLYDSAYQLCTKIFDKNIGFKSQNDLYNLVGCIQLYLYSQIEGFDYFFTVLIDKNIINESDDNGKYWYVKNCKSDDSILLKHFDIVLDHLKFKSLDSTTTSQGRTGKIIIKR